jgi:hypothetical protein
MLTCYNDNGRFPQSDLAYVGFRLAILDTLTQMDLSQDLDEDDGTLGFLADVPFLAQVAPQVQVDLLADLWARHRDTALHEASLLDAAVLYAALHTAGRVIHDQAKVARLWLRAGPRPVNCRLGGRTAGRLCELFFDFWDDIDFLSLSGLEDLEPEHARAVRELMGFPDGDVTRMEEARTRWRASPTVLAKLEGLLTEEEIRGYGKLFRDAGRG